MKKSLLIGTIVALVVVGGVTVFYAMHKSSNSNLYGSNTSSSNMPKASSNNSSSSAPSVTDKVMINNYAFTPANITVKAGATVTWMNMDSVSHIVTETDGKTGPASDPLPNGKSYSFTYKTAGTYKYNCSIHPDMIGTVTVTN
jgi:plastocyanin